jgi:putative membrane protein
MFIDYTAIMLVGIATGFVLLADYLFRSPQAESRVPWAAGFFAVGLLGVLTSLPMVLTWPLPGSYNIAFGEPALFLSIAFLAAGMTLALRWEPLIPSIFGAFGGLIAVVVGLRIWGLGMTTEPALTGIGYLAAGLGGILTLPAIQFRQTRWLALLAAILLALAALIFLVIGYEAYWAHLVDFAKYLPASMAHAAAKPAK